MTAPLPLWPSAKAHRCMNRIKGNDKMDGRRELTRRPDRVRINRSGFCAHKARHFATHGRRSPGHRRGFCNTRSIQPGDGLELRDSKAPCRGRPLLERRNPEGAFGPAAGVGMGIMFLLTARACFFERLGGGHHPVMFLAQRSTSINPVSVPPETIRKAPLSECARERGGAVCRARI